MDEIPEVSEFIVCDDGFVATIGSDADFDAFLRWMYGTDEDEDDS